jgi:hypothetical protein
VILGSGQAFETAGMTFAAGLPHGIKDAGWADGTLITLLDNAGSAEIQRWSPGQTATATATFDGKPLRLWPLGSTNLVLTLDNGQPRMSLLDSALGVVFQSPINRAPTAITLDPAGVPENAPAGTLVGNLGAIDPDPDDSAQFRIVGDWAASFRVTGTQLFTSQPFNFEQSPTLTVPLAAVDRHGLSFTQSVTITITNVNEAPTSVALSHQSIREEAPVGTTVALVSADDPDSLTGDTLSFTLIDNSDGRFRLAGNRLEVARALDFHADPRPTVRIRAMDTAGATVEESLEISLVELPAPMFTTRVVGTGTDQLLWTDAVLPQLGFGMLVQLPVCKSVGHQRSRP